jgi:hypothetical protein
MLSPPDGAPLILAAGGFAADRYLLREHVTENADDVLLRTAPGSSGDGMRVGWTPAPHRHGAGRGVRQRNAGTPRGSCPATSCGWRSCTRRPRRAVRLGPGVPRVRRGPGRRRHGPDAPSRWAQPAREEQDLVEHERRPGDPAWGVGSQPASGRAAWFTRGSLLQPGSMGGERVSFGTRSSGERLLAPHSKNRKGGFA